MSLCAHLIVLWIVHKGQDGHEDIMRVLGKCNLPNLLDRTEDDYLWDDCACNRKNSDMENMTITSTSSSTNEKTIMRVSYSPVAKLLK